MARPGRAFLYASLALWRRRERYRKKRHDYWQQRVNKARDAGEHPRRHLILRRNRWAKLLAQARAKVELRERQLAVPQSARGIDVSNNNGHVDFAKVRAAGYRFVFVKATEGLTFRDPFLIQNVLAAKRAGLQVGAYHFLSGSSTGAAQAAFFADRVRAAGLKPGDLLPVVDVEKEGVAATHVGAFVHELERQFGVRPLIYTFPSFMTWPSTFGCKLWIAHFGVTRPTIPAPWKKWAAWQHSSTGHVPGVSGNCDLNVTANLEELIWR